MSLNAPTSTDIAQHREHLASLRQERRTLHDTLLHESSEANERRYNVVTFEDIPRETAWFREHGIAESEEKTVQVVQEHEGL